MRKQQALWLAVALAASFELAVGFFIRSTVPTDASWGEAADFVRARFGPHDRIVAAPSWVDPIVRSRLGDLLSLRAAAPSDLAGFERVWELGIRGASTRPDPPELEARFGRVRVRMWSVSSDEVRYDFVERIAEARVELAQREGSRLCPWMDAPVGPGGLGRGPMAPEQRFVCDPSRPWLWVGSTVLADLSLEPRRCVWQHPAGAEPIRVTFPGVPLTDHMVVHAGIDYSSERRREGSPVTLRVWIADSLVGELVHRDGDGWSELTLDTRKWASHRASVRFETTTVDPAGRLFCWSAYTRAEEARHE